MDLQLQNRICFQWTGTSAKTPWYDLLLQFQFFQLKTSEVQILLKLDVLLISGAENDILCEEHFLKKESFLHITLSSSREKWMMKVNSWTYDGPGFYRDSASKKADNWLRSRTGVIPQSAAKEPNPQINCSKQHLPSICSWRSSSWSVGWLTHGCSCRALYPRRSWHTETHRHVIC